VWPSLTESAAGILRRQQNASKTTEKGGPLHIHTPAVELVTVHQGDSSTAIALALAKLHSAKTRELEATAALESCVRERSRLTNLLVGQLELAGSARNQVQDGERCKELTELIAAAGKEGGLQSEVEWVGRWRALAR